MAKCPYCGRKLSETERYCVNCELDVSKARDEEEKPKISLKAKKTLLDDAKEIVKWVKGKIKK